MGNRGIDRGVGQGIGGGRPRTELTVMQKAEIEPLAATLNQEQIADYLGIPARTFRSILARDDEVSAAYKRGRAKSVENVGRGLLQRALNGDGPAQMFYLKTQAGWRETNKHEVEATVVDQEVPDIRQLARAILAVLGDVTFGDAKEE